MFLNKKKKILAELKLSGDKVKTEGFNFELIERYHKNKENSNAFQVLSDQTCDDLDFDLFFSFIDRTSSKIGQQFLYDRFKTANYEADKIDEQEKIISHLLRNPEERLEIQFILQKLNTSKAYYLSDIFQKEHEKNPKWLFIIPLLSFTAFFSIILSFINSSLLVIPLLLLPIHVFIHYAMKRKINVFIDSIPPLLQLSFIAKKLIRFDFLSAQINDRKKSIAVIDALKKRMSLFKLEHKVDSELEAIFWILIEYIKITFLLDPLLFYSSVDKIKMNLTEIEDVYKLVGEIDVLVSIANLRVNLENYCLPDIKKDNSSIKGADIYHPLLTNSISNSFESGGNSFLLTGSNMSGKTTFIRAVGLNCISAMVLNTCFAESFSMPVLKIHSVIRISDDITNASSYFFKEVEAMKSIIEKCDSEHSNLILLDELFKGTNTLERIASAKSILSYINKNNNYVFVSTHDIELTTLLKNEYDLYYFKETIREKQIIFDYKLKKGIPESGNAIEILRINNYPASIIDGANAIVKDLETL